MIRNEWIPTQSDDTMHHANTEFETDDTIDVDAWGNQWDIDEDEAF